jgi:hypothetical protein
LVLCRLQSLVIPRPAPSPAPPPSRPNSQRKTTQPQYWRGFTVDIAPWCKTHPVCVCTSLCSTKKPDGLALVASASSLAVNTTKNLQKPHTDSTRHNSFSTIYLHDGCKADACRPRHAPAAPPFSHFVLGCLRFVHAVFTGCNLLAIVLSISEKQRSHPILTEYGWPLCQVTWQHQYLPTSSIRELKPSLFPRSLLSKPSLRDFIRKVKLSVRLDGVNPPIGRGKLGNVVIRYIPVCRIQRQNNVI